MKSTVGMRVKLRIHKLLNSIGVHVRSYTNALQHQDPLDLIRTLDGLRQCGFLPELVVDVGARQGSWSFLASRVWPGANFLLIEPQVDYESRLDLSFLQARWVNVAVDTTPGVKPFYIPSNKGSASLVRSHIGSDETVTQTQVTTLPLSQVIEQELGGIVPQLIKVDAEGKDREVFSSLGPYLKDVSVCFLEAALPLNSIPSNLEQTLTLMTESGFSAVDLGFASRHPSHRLLLAVEICFVQTQSDLYQQLYEYTAG